MARPPSLRGWFLPLFGLTLLFVSAFLLLFANGASSAVIGIDFGSEFIKVASVKPGTPFHIVIDEQSKRKVPSVVAFEGGERHFGNGATQMSMRKPKETYWFVHRLLGKSIDAPQVLDFKEQGYAYEIVPIEARNSVGFRHTGFDGNTTIYTAEELIAMNLQHIVRICEVDADAPGSVKDAVLTVPNYWTQKERQALIDAAELAGLNVLSLVNDNSAAAVQYGIDRKYGENDTVHTVLFYNMGSTATTVSLVEFSSYTIKGSRGAKNRTVGQAEVRGVAFDDTLGGQYFEARLTDWIVAQVNAELAKRNKETKDIKVNPRAMAKIRSAADKAKTVLSANIETPIFLTSLVHDIDFKLHLTRDEYVKLCDDLIRRVGAPITAVLKESGYEPEQVDQVMILGGNVRIPAVQQAIKQATGREQLGQGLNGDEAFAMGAVFRAANQSTAFQVRPFGLIDVTPYPVGVRIADLDETAAPDVDLSAEPTSTETVTDDESASSSSSSSTSPSGGFSKRASLFKRHNRLGKRKTVAFQHNKDFSVNLFHDSAALLPAGVTPAILSYNVTGLSEISAQGEASKYAHLLAAGQKPRVSLSFLLDASGLSTLVKAEATLEEMVKVVVPKKKNETAKVNETETENTNGAETANSNGTNSEEGEERADGAEEQVEGEGETVAKTEREEKTEESGSSEEEKSSEGSSSSAADASAESADSEPEYKLEKKLHYLPLRVTRGGLINSAQPMNSGDKKESRAKLNRLTRADEQKKEIAFAKNNVESYIYATRAAVSENEELQTVSTEEQRQAVLDSLSAAEDWLYEQAEDSASHFQSKLAELQALYEPLSFRLAELSARPEALNSSSRFVNFTRAQVADYKENRPWVPEADRDKLEKLVDEFEEWLNPLKEKQESLGLTDKPAVGSKDIYDKMRPIAKLSSDLMKLKKPAEKPKKKEETGKGKKGAKGGKNETEEEGNEEAAGGTGGSSSEDGEETKETPTNAEETEKTTSTTEEQQQQQEKSSNEESDSTSASNPDVKDEL